MYMDLGYHPYIIRYGDTPSALIMDALLLVSTAESLVSSPAAYVYPRRMFLRVRAYYTCIMYRGLPGSGDHVVTQH